MHWDAWWISYAAHGQISRSESSGPWLWIGHSGNSSNAARGDCAFSRLCMLTVDFVIHSLSYPFTQTWPSPNHLPEWVCSSAHHHTKCNNQRRRHHDRQGKMSLFQRRLGQLCGQNKRPRKIRRHPNVGDHLQHPQLRQNHTSPSRKAEIGRHLLSGSKATLLWRRRQHWPIQKCLGQEWWISGGDCVHMYGECGSRNSTNYRECSQTIEQLIINARHKSDH